MLTGNLLGPTSWGAISWFCRLSGNVFCMWGDDGDRLLLTLFNTKEHFTPIPAKKMKPMKRDLCTIRKQTVDHCNVYHNVIYPISLDVDRADR